MEYVNAFFLILVQIVLHYYALIFAVDMENAQKTDVNVIKDLKVLIVLNKYVIKIVMEMVNVSMENAFVNQALLEKTVIKLLVPIIAMIMEFARELVVFVMLIGKE